VIYAMVRVPSKDDAFPARLHQRSTFEPVIDVHQLAPYGVHCRGEEMESRVSGPKSSSSGKKPYHRPTCTRKSISEVGTLLRKKASDQENTLGAGGVFALGDLPILLVEDCEGDLRFIGQTAHTPTRQLEPFSIVKGEGLVEMQFADGQGVAPPETFLLLDLRHRRNGERGLLESIGGDPNLSNAVPLVILVSSMEQFRGWRGIDAAHCWQLRGRPSAVDLAMALRSFLHLCATLAKWPPEGGRALDNAVKYALIGKANKEGTFCGR